VDAKSRKTHQHICHHIWRPLRAACFSILVWAAWSALEGPSVPVGGAGLSLQGGRGPIGQSASEQQQDAERQAKAAADAETRRKASEAERQRLAALKQRETKAAAEAEARRGQAKEQQELVPPAMSPPPAEHCYFLECLESAAPTGPRPAGAPMSPRRQPYALAQGGANETTKMAQAKQKLERDSQKERLCLTRPKL
jgi:hypothetical protein